MDALETIFRRRSIRIYQVKEVDKETIMTLLKAATAAPTAANCQPWEFIVINDADKLNELKSKLVFAKYNAPVAIVVCGNMKLAFKGLAQEMWVQDCSAAIENILIAATGLGLGSVWIGVYPGPNVKLVKAVLNIPGHVTPLGIDKASQWYVTGTSYINELVIEDNNLSNIVDNGNTIYYDSTNEKNSWLEGKTIQLNGGGKLVPVAEK